MAADPSVPGAPRLWADSEIRRNRMNLAFGGSDRLRRNRVAFADTTKRWRSSVVTVVVADRWLRIVVEPGSRRAGT